MGVRLLMGRQSRFIIGTVLAGLMAFWPFLPLWQAAVVVGPQTARAAGAEQKNAIGDSQTAAVNTQEDALREMILQEINLYLGQMDTTDLAASLKLFRVMNLLNLKYTGEVSTGTLLTGAVKGTVESLKDPYSLYMDPDTFKDFSIETSGSFSGAGIVLGVKDKALTVIAPIEGTPGEQAGIKSGDLILKVDGKDTKDMALDQAVHLIRGPEGTQVVLTVGRSGEEAKDYTIIRANVQLQTVAGRMMGDGIGYLRVSMFSEHTAEDFTKKLKELEDQGLRAVILDLRNNPGGLIDAGVNVAGQFVPKGPVVSYETKDGSRITYFSNLPAPRYPLAVLVNGGSASASEILAGAVQDTGAGTLIGTKTFGKGSVQNVIPFYDASAVKLTVAKWFTPKGRPIDGVGIEPDIMVEMSDAKENEKDLQLETAVELLKTKLQ
ncbi:MAG: S41 family peptidase [Bacillota bacterium]